MSLTAQKFMKNIFLPLTLLFAAAFISRAESTNALVLEKRIAVGNLFGRFDHMAADVKGQRLFVAALQDNALQIVDLKAGKKIQSIDGLHKPSGVAYLPEQNQICVANGGDGTCKIYDGKTFALTKTIEGLADADNLRYDEKTKLLYVGFGSGALAVIDVAQNIVVGQIPLSAHPEAFALEKNGPRIFVNLPEKRQIAVVDRQKKNVTLTWVLQKVAENFPMALDEKNHRLFIGCRKPPGFLALDTDSGKIVAALPTSEDTDDLFFDEANQRCYISCGEGSVEVIQQIDSDHYKPLEKIPTGRKGRTALFIPDLKLFCVVTPARIPQPAEVWVFNIR